MEEGVQPNLREPTGHNDGEGRSSLDPTNTRTDQSTTVEDLRSLIREFVTERAWEKYHVPKNLAMSIAIEAAELMEHFQWLPGEEGWAIASRSDTRAEVEDELADVLIYALAFANAIDSDVSQIVRRKMERNQGRFPAREVQGTLGKSQRQKNEPE